MIIAIGIRYSLTDQIDEPEYIQIQEHLEPPFAPIETGYFLGKTSEIGSLSSYRIPVQNLERNIGKCGYANVFCVERTMMPLPEKYENIVLLDWNNNPVTYPLNSEESNLANRLNELIDAEEVFIRGELYNCSAWDGSWFLGLKVSNEKMYYIKDNPKPLDETQFVITLDRSKYPPNGTVKISVWNWSEDWLNIGSESDLFRFENGSWVKFQNCTLDDDFYGVHVVFPENNAEDELSLNNLEAGEYKVIKKVWRGSSKRFSVEAQFTIIEPTRIDPQYIEDSPFNLFDFDLFNQLYKEDENLVISPVSIHQILGMIHEGARKETAEEMRQALYLSTNDTLRHETYRDNMQLSDQVENANAIWVDDNYLVLEEYMEVIKEYFMGESENIDYSNAEQARDIINQWAENKTHGKIVELLPENSINSDTRLVLTNAIYFQGAWKYAFNTNLTSEAPFMVNENKTVTVDMMKLTSRCDFYDYTNDSQVKMVRLPYKNCNLSMYIILPINNTINDTLSYLTADKLNQLIDSMEPQMFDIYLPRFQISNEYKLKGTLQDMGIIRVFGDADLSGINDEKELFVDEVYHRAFIDVNEEGTEASAATSGVVAIGMKYNPFRADHPFIYLIRDDFTDTILFIGAVNDPSN